MYRTTSIYGMQYGKRHRNFILIKAEKRDTGGGCAHPTSPPITQTSPKTLPLGGLEALPSINDTRSQTRVWLHQATTPLVQLMIIGGEGDIGGKRGKGTHITVAPCWLAGHLCASARRQPLLPIKIPIIPVIPYETVLAI